MDPYIGEIEIFAFGFAPQNWAVCAGQLLPINQNQALFSLLGTTYGGDGIRTFALPNLQGRVAIGQGAGPGLTSRTIGQVGGEENHTLTIQETPAHTHSLNTAANANTANNTDTPGSTVVLTTATGTDKGNQLTVLPYVSDPSPSQALASTALNSIGGQAHSNVMPYLAVNYCISLSGIFPSRN
jgi:microcystin-dependent protein